MKLFLHLITLVVTLSLAVSGVLAWRLGLHLVESQTFHYDGIVDGEITRAKAEGEGNYLSPGLRYVFRVDDLEVTGENYRRNFIKKKEFSKAREIAAKHEPGAKVKVYYRVGAHGAIHSVLNPHPDPLAHLLYVGGIPLSFCVVTLYLAVVALRPRRGQAPVNNLPPSEPEEEESPKKTSD